MSKLAIVAALEREVSGLPKVWHRAHRRHEGRNLVFFERADTVLVCGGTGPGAPPPAAGTPIAPYHPPPLPAVGLPGARGADKSRGGGFSSPPFPAPPGPRAPL